MRNNRLIPALKKAIEQWVAYEVALIELDEILEEIDKPAPGRIDQLRRFVADIGNQYSGDDEIEVDNREVDALADFLAEEERTP